jgi:hypothetical protein
VKVVNSTQDRSDEYGDVSSEGGPIEKGRVRSERRREPFTSPNSLSHE